MIRYESGKFHLGLICRLRGSVFPRANQFSLPVAIVSIILKILLPETDDEEFSFRILTNAAAYSSFTFVLGFILVFRTSQSYARFWEGAESLHHMRAEWFDAVSSLAAISNATVVSKGISRDAADRFQHILVRLVSLLHSVALKHVCDMHHAEFEVIDINGLDRDHLQYLSHAKTKGWNQPNIVYHWIMQHCMNSASAGYLAAAPGPVFARTLTEVSNGMTHFHNACKIKETPFPFPYAQMITLMLFLYMISTPLIVAIWTDHWIWTGCFTWLGVFAMWSMNLIAVEIEHPFGDDTNDLGTHEEQMLMNLELMVLLDPRMASAPTLSDRAQMSFDTLSQHRNSLTDTLSHRLSRTKTCEGGIDEAHPSSMCEERVSPQHDENEEKSRINGGLDVDAASSEAPANKNAKGSLKKEKKHLDPESQLVAFCEGLHNDFTSFQQHASHHWVKQVELLEAMLKEISTTNSLLNREQLQRDSMKPIVELSTQVESRLVPIKPKSNESCCGMSSRLSPSQDTNGLTRQNLRQP